jgi:transcriptional regulator with XRE-family HTH domain
MFWDNYTKLCRENGTSPTALTIELGFSNATATRWKKGAIPNGSTLKKIADHFGITVSDLLGETKKEQPVQDDSKDAALAALGDLVEDLNDEQVQELRQYAEYLKSRKK